MNESAIVSQILRYLQFLENQGKVYAFRNNSFQGHITRRYFTKSRGLVHTQGYIHNAKKGMPDIICCYKGFFIGFEVKVKGNKQSEYQKEAEKMIKEAGGQYFVVTDVDEVKAIIDNVGING